MGVFYVAKWSAIRDLSKAILGRALFIISLAPFIARLIDFLQLIDCKSISWEVAFIGAWLFAVTSAILKLTIPPLIVQASNSLIYRDDITRKAELIDFRNHFGNIDVLLERHGSIFAEDLRVRILEAMPPQNAYERLGAPRAAYLLAEAYYRLMDVSRPYLRTAIGFLLVLSMCMMVYSTLYYSCVIMREL